jgi:hypothetical protein
MMGHIFPYGYMETPREHKLTHWTQRGKHKRERKHSGWLEENYLREEDLYG